MIDRGFLLVSERFSWQQTKKWSKKGSRQKKKIWDNRLKLGGVRWFQTFTFWKFPTISRKISQIYKLRGGWVGFTSLSQFSLTGFTDVHFFRCWVIIFIFMNTESFCWSTSIYIIFIASLNEIFSFARLKTYGWINHIILSNMYLTPAVRVQRLPAVFIISVIFHVYIVPFSSQ